MKCLFIAYRDIENPRSGGASMLLHTVARKLAARGHDVVILSSSFADAPKLVNHDHVTIIRSGNAMFPHLGFLVRYLKELRNEFDVVIEEMGSGQIPFFSTLWIREPLVVLAHQRQKEVFYSELPAPLALLATFIERLFPIFYRKICFIVPSESVRLDFSKLGIPSGNIRVITPAMISHPETRSVGKRSSALVFLSRLRRYKGAHHAISVVDSLHRRGLYARLTIAGKRSDSRYEAYLRSLVKSRNLDSYVEFEPNVSEQRKWQLLQTSRGLVIPSLKEGFGFVVLEANACGTPAVGFKTTGLEDTIVHGRTGFTTPIGDVEQLSHAIERLLSDDELFNYLSENALKWSKAFDWEATIMKFEETLIRQIASSMRAD